MTPKEFDLLLMMVSKRGAVITREEIGQVIWGRNPRTSSPGPSIRMSGVYAASWVNLRSGLKQSARTVTASTHSKQRRKSKHSEEGKAIFAVCPLLALMLFLS